MRRQTPRPLAAPVTTITRSDAFAFLDMVTEGLPSFAKGFVVLVADRLGCLTKRLEKMDLENWNTEEEAIQVTVMCRINAGGPENRLIYLGR